MNSLGDKAMITRELDRETYRRIIESYFRAFGTRGLLARAVLLTGSVPQSAQ
jgi:hypothetical protein